MNIRKLFGLFQYPCASVTWKLITNPEMRKGFYEGKKKHVWCCFDSCHLYTKQHLVVSFELALMHRNLDCAVNFSLREKTFFMFCVHHSSLLALR